MQQNKTRENHRIYRSTRPLMHENYDLYKYSKTVYVTLTEDECIQLYKEGGESNNYNGGGHVGGDWLLNKINEVLYLNKIQKNQLAKELGISKSALSLQFNKLKKGCGINTKTLEAVEKLTGYNFFSF